MGATVAIFFSVRLYQDGKDENLTAAAVLLCLGSVLTGAFLVMVAIDFAVRRDTELRRDDQPRPPT
jgi:hypothetical protein